MLIILMNNMLNHENNYRMPKIVWSFPVGSSGKDPTCQCRRRKRCGFIRDVGLIPGTERSPEGGHGNPLQ